MKVAVQSRVKEYIDTHGIRRSYISKVTGIRPDTLRHILCGERELRADELESICMAIDKEPGYFMKTE